MAQGAATSSQLVLSSTSNLSRPGQLETTSITGLIAPPRVHTARKGTVSSTAALAALREPLAVGNPDRLHWHQPSDHLADLKGSSGCPRQLPAVQVGLQTAASATLLPSAASKLPVCHSAVCKRPVTKPSVCSSVCGSSVSSNPQLVFDPGGSSVKVMVPLV